MTTLLLCAAAYWLFSFGFSTFCFYRYAGGADAVYERVWRQSTASRWRIRVAMVAAWLGLFLIAPVLAPVTFLQGYLAAGREQKYRKQLQRTHREYLFKRLHEVNLPREVRQFFDACAEDAEQLGFTTVGDYQMKEEPENYFGRLMVSDDGQAVFGSISLCNSTPASFSTLFSGGQVLETTSSEPAGAGVMLMDHDYYRAVFAPGFTIEQLWKGHQMAVEYFAQEQGVTPLAFAPEQAEDILRYEGRVFSQILYYERGELDAAPPEPELPTPRNP